MCVNFSTAKIYHAEIVKFGLILTHLKLFGGGGKQENILRGNVHCGAAAAAESSTLQPCTL